MNYNSVFKEEIISYIKYKKSNGYSFNSEIVKLRNFDKYLVENNIKEKKLTKELVISFIDSHKARSKTVTLVAYASLIRQFALYLCRIEIDAYIIPINYYSAKRNFIPYIYTNDEMESIFTAKNYVKLNIIFLDDFLYNMLNYYSFLYNLFHFSKRRRLLKLWHHHKIIFLLLFLHIYLIVMA